MNNDDTEMIEKWKYDLSFAIWEKHQKAEDFAVEEAVRAICSGKKDDFKKSLFEIIRILKGKETVSLLKKDKEFVYFLY